MIPRPIHGQTIKPASAEQLARWFHSGGVVAFSKVGAVTVRTAFTYETTITGGEHDGYSERCSRWEEAEAQHQTALDRVTERAP